MKYRLTKESKWPIRNLPTLTDPETLNSSGSKKHLRNNVTDCYLLTTDRTLLSRVRGFLI